MTFLVYPSPAPSDLAVNLISDSVFVITRSVCRATSSPALPISRPLMVTATSVPHLGWLGTWLTPVTSPRRTIATVARSEEHTSELQSLAYLVCRLLLEKKKKQK